MRVTVGLPFSDQGRYLDEAINSVLAQDHRDWELILVSDGASDQTLSIARQHEDSDERITVVGDSTRKGLAFRLNEIAAMASTETIFRMDADDVMAPSRLSKQVEFLDANPHVDLVGSRAFIIDEESKVRGLYVEAELPAEAAGYLKNGVFTHPTIAGRTKWFRNNPYNEQLMRAQDKELWLRSFRSSNFVKLNTPLLFYRVNSRISRAARQYSSKVNQQIIRMYGPQIIGERETRSYLRRARIKDAVFSLAASTSFTNRLMYERKISAIPLSDLERAREDLSCATSGRETSAR